LSLYRALSTDGNPEFATILRVMGTGTAALRCSATAKEIRVNKS